MFDSLQRHIQSRLAAHSPLEVNPRQLTVGLEHEFFLTREGKPCAHVESQEFLLRLSRLPHWHIQSTSEDAQLGKIIERVSFDDPNGRFTAVKYDHHPHLLEIAFAYQNSALELLELVMGTLFTLSEIARTLGLNISSENILDIRANDPSVVSPLRLFQNLRHYRALLIERKPGKPRRYVPGLENYAAVIAATQTHVGGIDWWNRPNFLNQLYSVEPLIMPWASLQCSDDAASASRLLRKRWGGYQAVFEGFPLVGFPDLPSWSIDHWARALMRSPVCGTSADDYASKSLNEIGSNPFGSWEAFFKEVRDLQIIRPRFFGTLEFRSDPSQPDAAAICALAALRLGLCSHFMTCQRAILDFSISREKWWSLVNDGFEKADGSVFDSAEEGLITRGFGEEKLLERLIKVCGEAAKGHGMKSAAKQITDQLVIAGFFREALFHSQPVQILCGEKHLSARLVELLEESSRAEQGVRKLRLEFQEPLPAEYARGPVQAEFRCAFPRFVAYWSGELVENSRNGGITRVPQLLRIENHRASNRIRLSTLIERSVSVLLSSNGRYTEGTLQLENHSSDGCGGMLRTIPSFELGVGTLVQGLLRSPHGNYRIDGQIAQIQLLSASVTPDGENTFNVGIVNTRAESAPSGPERRKGSRIKTEFPITVISPLNPDHGIDLIVRSASSSGFAARLEDSSDRILLSQALCVKFRAESMLAQVVSEDGAGFRFQFVDGSPEDRLKWLSRLSKAQPGVSMRTAVGMDIIDLFCESGAFSSKFIAEQAHRSTDILAGLASDERNGGWVHRWIERTQDGEIRGHSSAIRISDQLWHLGDIAGMRQLDKKISKDLVPSFFRMFKDFCLSLQPCPRTVISWVEGHSYWKGFERHLETLSPHESFSVVAEYVRTHHAEASVTSRWGLERIEAQDFARIEDCLSNCVEPDHRAFLAALDFSIGGFGSPILAGVLREHKLPFQRVYALAQLGDERCLVVFSAFPSGVCPQQSIEAPWVFPLGPSRPENTASLIGSIRAFGLRNGFRFPGVLLARSRVVPADEQVTKRMLWTICHPKALSFFGRKEE